MSKQDEGLDKALEAIWPMCRKNEMYTLNMFKNDMRGKMLSLIPEEKDVYKLRHGNIICNTWHEEGFNEAIRLMKDRMGK